MRTQLSSCVRMLRFRINCTQGFVYEAPSFFASLLYLEYIFYQKESLLKIRHKIKIIDKGKVCYVPDIKDNLQHFYCIYLNCIYLFI